MHDFLVDLDDYNGAPVVIVKGKITHVSASGGTSSIVHLVGGQEVRVPTSVPETIARIWPGGDD